MATVNGKVSAAEIKEIVAGWIATGIVSRVKDQNAHYGVREYSGDDIKRVLLSAAEDVEIVENAERTDV